MADTPTTLTMTVLTVSDSRTASDDTSGDYLVERLEENGHQVKERLIVKDNVFAIRAIVSQWIADDEVQGVLVTGGTGFSGRDSTPEALMPLFDKHIDGFGELFRALSFQDIGSSTVQSRACAGLANDTVIFCLPGSTGACRTAWEGILHEQLNSLHKPCNFVNVVTHRPQRNANSKGSPGSTSS